MVSTGLDNISRLQWDNSTVGVGNQTSVSKTIDSYRVDNSSSSSMGNLGSIDIRGVGRDNSSVSVGNETMGVSNSIGESIAYRENMSKMAKVSSSGSSNSRSVSRDDSSVGESHQSSGGDGHTGSKNLKYLIIKNY